MRILVTGGTGTSAGSSFASCGRGATTSGCATSPTTTTRSTCAATCRSYRQLERARCAPSGFDLVYHLAAEFGRWNGEDYYETLWRSNAIGTKNVLRLQEKHRFRLVFFSSSEVYGDWDGVMSEDVMDQHEVRQLNDYAITKWVGEQQILNSAAMHGTESVRVRLFNTYGPGEYYSPYRSVICRVRLPRAARPALHRLPQPPPHLDLRRRLPRARWPTSASASRPGEVYNIGGTEYHDVKAASRT